MRERRRLTTARRGPSSAAGKHGCSPAHRLAHRRTGKAVPGAATAAAARTQLSAQRSFVTHAADRLQGSGRVPPGATARENAVLRSCHEGSGTGAVAETALLRHARSRPIARLGRTTAKSRGPGPTKRLAHRRTQKSRCQEPPRRQRHGRGRRTGAPSSRTQPTDCKARAYDGAESRAWPTKRLEHRRTQKAVPGAATKATARTRSS